MASLTDTILNDPNNHDPKTWLAHMDAALASDPKKDEKIAQALRAYLEAAAPKTLQDLLQLSKTKASEAQAWISILPPDTKARFVSEIQSAISALSPAAQPVSGTGGRAASGININKVIEKVAEILNGVDPAYTSNHASIALMAERQITSLKNHPDLNKMRGGVSNIKRLDDTIRSSKFTDDKIKEKLHQVIADLQEDDAITESHIPVVNIKSQLKQII